MLNAIDTTASATGSTDTESARKPRLLKKLIIPIGIAAVAGMSALLAKVVTAKDAMDEDDDFYDDPVED